jgi:imidazolonepropionase-like amidohydrolase
VAVDPTLAYTEYLLTGRPGELPRYAAAVAQRLPVEGARRWSHGGALPPLRLREAYQADSFPRLKELVRELHDAGVPLVLGTDELPGFTLQREIELYVESGIPPADVLYLATLGAAERMQLDPELGSVAVGKRADLILIDGNPLDDIGDIRRVVLTIKDGVLYDTAELYRVLGVRPCCPADP